MQRASLKGLKEVTQGVYQLAEHVWESAVTTDSFSLSKGFLICHCLYQASQECAWFIQEDHSAEGVACLKAIVELLRAIAGRWRVAGKPWVSIVQKSCLLANSPSEEYLRCLEAEGALVAIAE
jgi:hypothetical protein